MSSLTEPVLLHPYVRFINASTVSGIDFHIFNTPVAVTVPCAYAGEYVRCIRGLTTFKACRSGEVLASMAINAEPGHVHSICAIGTEENVSLYAISEDTVKSNQEYGNLRICNLRKQEENIDVYANGACFASDIGYLDVTKYIEMIPDTYNIEVRNHGSKAGLLACGTQNIRCRKYNSLYILPPSSGSDSPGCIFTVDSGSYSGFYL